MPKYKIIKGNDEDIKSSIIRKTGGSTEFTLNQALSNALILEKQKKELESKLEVSKVWVENIEKHHAIVYDLTEEQMFAIHKYQEEKGMVKAVTAKLAEIDEALKEHASEMEEIYKQIPELK